MDKFQIGFRSRVLNVFVTPQATYILQHNISDTHFLFIQKNELDCLYDFKLYVHNILNALCLAKK